MTYTSRAMAYQKARRLAGSAMSSSWGHRRLQHCHALLQELDPDKPPAAVHAREFRWQYRALRERIHLYSRCLEASGDLKRFSDGDLRKAETAIELSLRYFNDVLTPAQGPEDEDENS